MFAYCLNDPVNRSDINGTTSLWFYLIENHDMGFVHRAVVADIQKTYSVQTEVPLSGYGRADIVNGSSVWEVKHAGKKPVQRMILAFSEACGYVLLNNELDTVGVWGAFDGSLYIGCADSSYRVEYCTPFWGAVLYTVSEDPSYKGAYAAVVVPKNSKSETTIPHMAGTLGIAGTPFAFGGEFGGGPSFGFTKHSNSFN